MCVRTYLTRSQDSQWSRVGLCKAKSMWQPLSCIGRIACHPSCGMLCAQAHFMRHPMRHGTPW